MATTSQLLGGVFDYLGRPSQDKLNLGLVLPFLLDAIDFYNVDLQLSSENWLLKSFIYSPVDRDELVTAPGFSVPVSMEIRDAASTDDADWMPILISNLTDVQAIGSDGTRAVAFYGRPPRCAWSFNPTDSQIDAKLWYEPIGKQPTTLSDSPQLSQAFHSMLKLKTALTCVPYAFADAEKAGLVAASLTAQLAGWERKWKLWTTVDRNAQPVQKRDFRGARAMRGQGKIGWWW